MHTAREAEESLSHTGRRLGPWTFTQSPSTSTPANVPIGQGNQKWPLGTSVALLSPLALCELAFALF